MMDSYDVLWFLLAPLARPRPATASLQLGSYHGSCKQGADAESLGYCGAV